MSNFSHPRHTRAPCTRSPARASPTLVLGRFRPGLRVVRQCGHAGSAPAQAQDGGSASCEVSLGSRLHSFVAHPCICAVSAGSHALALCVALTTAIDFALAGSRHCRWSACHARSLRTLSWATGEPSHAALFSCGASVHMRGICVLSRARARRCSDDRDRFFALAGDRWSYRSHGCGRC